MILGRVCCGVRSLLRRLSVVQGPTTRRRPSTTKQPTTVDQRDQVAIELTRLEAQAQAVLTGPRTNDRETAGFRLVRLGVLVQLTCRCGASGRVMLPPAGSTPFTCRRCASNIEVTTE